MAEAESGPKQSLWNASDDVYSTLKKLIHAYHDRLIMYQDEIAVVFKQKKSKAGDVEVWGGVSKAPKILNGVLDENQKFQFIITLAYDAWCELSDTQRMALLDHYLCACRVEPTDNGDKLYLSSPDVSFYQEEFERHGFWRTTGIKIDSKDIFGD